MLVQNARYTRLNQLERFLFAHSCCDHENGSREASDLRLTSKVHSGFGPQIKIQENNSWSCLLEQMQRFPGRCAPSNDFEIGFFCEQYRYAFAKEGVIVDHHQSDRLGMQF